MLREGLVPVIAGTIVTAAGSALRGVDMSQRGMKKRDVVPLVEAAVVGFGLAHIILGSIDLMQSRHQ